MTDGLVEPRDALAPLVTALLEAAQRDADALLDAAEREAAEAVAEATTRAGHLIDESRAKGTADGEAVLAAERARAERQARGLVLRARGDMFAAAHTTARDAVGRLRERSDYPQVLAGLSAMAKGVLGEDAEVAEAPLGGVVATAGSRHLDLSLAALADDLADEHGDQVLGGWTP